MKSVKKNTTKKFPSKGLRLKWQLLSEVKPVVLTPKITRGIVVPKTPTNAGTEMLVP